jgi:mannose-6-phosphate isomerase-like protein (cupin superfamily)
MRFAVPRDDLPCFDVVPDGSYARILNGAQHELPSVSLMLAELQPGEGPAWLRHQYDEVFSIAEGIATFTIGDVTVTADYGQVVLVPPGYRTNS